MAQRKQSGFTLIELVMVILLLSILATVASVNFIDFGTDARIAVTKDELTSLKRGIAGDSRVSAAGAYTFPGYEQDMLGLPNALVDLVTNPATGDKTKDYDPLTRKGWRGPYVDDSAASDYSKDAWGVAYIYDKANRKIRSGGPNKKDDAGASDDLEIIF